MSYTPINDGAYTAAFAGAIAGMAVSGWITDPTAADYLPVCTIAGAFAEAFDTGWNNAAELNSLEVAAISSIASQNFKDRGPGPFGASLALAANWTQTALACVALVLESDAYFQSQGITPPTPGGAIAPLKDTIYVDSGFGPSAEDGSIGAPFLTLTAALQHFQIGLINGAEGEIIINGEGYNGETPDPITTLHVTFTSLRGAAGGPKTILPSLICSQSVLNFQGCFLVGLDMTDSNVGLLQSGVNDVNIHTTGVNSAFDAVQSSVGAIIAEADSANVIDLNNCTFGDITVAGGACSVRAYNHSSCSGAISVPDGVVQLTDCDVDTSVTTLNFIGKNSSIGSTVTADAIRLEETTVDTVVVNTGGQLFADLFSMTALRTGGPSTIEGLVITDAPLVANRTFTVPNLTAAMADVTGACAGARPGDTFIVSMEQQLAGVGIVGAWCAADNVLTLRFFGTTAGGDVHVNINRITNSG